MTAEDRPCDACNALPGQPCAWDCIGLAAEVDRIAELITDAVRDRCVCAAGEAMRHNYEPPTRDADGYCLDCGEPHEGDACPIWTNADR